MHLGKTIKQINTVFERDRNRMLQTYGLTAVQMDLLRLLYDLRQEGRPINQRGIEEAMMLKNPTVTGILNRLEDKGLVRRVAHPQDRRFKVIELTDKAVSMRSEIFDTVLQNESKLSQALTQEEREQLAALLEKTLSSLT